MPRYLVEHDFASDTDLPAWQDGTGVSRDAAGGHAIEGVTWMDTYVSADYTKTFCIYHAPTPEAIRRYAEKNRLPVNRITEIMLPEPFFCR
jgi:hypothetical protein